MKAFFLRSILILFLFFVSAALSSLTNISSFAGVIFFIAVTAWTLSLGFRRALWVVVPCLTLVDILWDGSVGALFLSGFLLSTAVTYLAVRIETRSYSIQLGAYSLVIALLATLATLGSLFFPMPVFTLALLFLFLQTFFAQLFITVLFFFPVSTLIHYAENFLDTSYREQSKKIR